MKAPKCVIAPDACAPYLTPGGVYLVEGWRETGDKNIASFTVIDDEGERIMTFYNGCPHSNGKWIIPSDETDDADDDPKTTKPRVTAVRVGDITVDCDENPHEIHVFDGSGDCIKVPRTDITALIEALKMMDVE